MVGQNISTTLQDGSGVNLMCVRRYDGRVDIIMKLDDGIGGLINRTVAKLVDIAVNETKAELADLKDKVEKSNKILPFTTEGLSWDGSPINIGFISSTSGVQSFNLPDELPMSASMVRIIAFHKSGNGGPGREVQYRIWTDVAGEEHVHFLYGYRYPQSVISFQSPEFWFPIEKTERIVKASTESLQPSNDHGVYLLVSGYKE